MDAGIGDKTGGGWLEQVRSRTLGVVKSGSPEWRQMRGRVFSKFHGRKMCELTPTGLHNTISLFLTLAATTTDSPDVISKLGEQLSLVPTSSPSKCRVVWRGLLAAALLLVEKGCEVTQVAERLSPLVAAVCHQLARDSPQRRELGQLLILYAEGVQEVFEHSHDLGLAQHSLICEYPGECWLPPCCSIQYVSAHQFFFSHNGSATGGGGTAARAPHDNSVPPPPGHGCRGGVGVVLPHAAAAEVKVTVGAMDVALGRVLRLSAHPDTITAGECGGLCD
ncbi:Protein MMS22-like [Chionoecetes opilio]|uniref:Protein MMS22-like n=1 Tax=Chionoecetes opilio TaxID=41210 RepID=A0A8J5CVJ0_CHIOP|nr:Protein MMS22-like [Chionoecetes opilio]